MTLDDHKAYSDACEAHNLTPLPLDADFAVMCALWSLGPHFIPYLSSTGSTWVHDMRHKTKRRDRPLAIANMEALRTGTDSGA